MALSLKTKNLQALADLGAVPSAVNFFKSHGVTFEKNKGDFGFTLHHGNKSWVLKSSSSIIPTMSLNEFLSEVIGELPNALSAVSGKGDKAAVPVPEVIPLRSADALYQRVIGTSKGSVYVVVGLSKSSGVKMAAKTNGVNALSVRVEEGSTGFKQEAVESLKAHSMALKSGNNFKYMSGHYECTPDAPPAKVLGSILLGCGIEFDTPMPNISEVIKGSQ